MSIEPAVATVSVIDPHRLERQRLEALITCGGWRPLFFASAAEFLAAPRAPAPGCLVLDLHLPGTAELLAQRPELAVIFATDSIDIPATVRAMKAGAIDVLTRPLQAQDVSTTIATAIEINRQRMRKQTQLDELRDRYKTLSTREREVMALVVSGLMNKQVSDRLNISVVTVKVHRGQVMRKMAAHSLAQLVRVANELDIEHPTPRPFSRPFRVVEPLSVPDHDPTLPTLQMGGIRQRRVGEPHSI